MLSITRNVSIPLRLRRKIGKMMPKPESGKDFEIDIFGTTYHGRTGNFMDNKIYVYGCHETATIRLIRQRLEEIRQKKGTSVYLDIGTNTGLHLIAAAPVCDAAYGFEPWEKVRTVAERHVKENNLKNVKIFPFGLADKDADLPYHAPEGGNLGTGFFTQKSDATAPESLSVRRGDDVIRENGIAPSLMKIDVEGFEKYVLEGLQHTLALHKPDIIFEYNAETRKDKPEDIEAILTLLEDEYEFYGILPSREMPKLVPFQLGKRYENVLATAKS